VRALWTRHAALIGRGQTASLAVSSAELPARSGKVGVLPP